MEFITTETETEALLLEANLIKQLKPRFNVLLRDDKSFPHILIEDGDYPLMRKHRGAKAGEGAHISARSPRAGAVNRTINQMQKAFLLRTCSDSVFDNRTRPCLLYQIKRCCGPCVDAVSPEDYGALVEDAMRFLEGPLDAGAGGAGRAHGARPRRRWSSSAPPLYRDRHPRR